MDSDDNFVNVEEVNIVVESSKNLYFYERMKRLSPHCLPLREHMKDQTIRYVDLL